MLKGKQSSETKGIRLTEAAAKKVHDLMQESDTPDDMYLYVGVKGGGCSGLSYVLDLRSEDGNAVKDTDEIYASQDITIVSDLKSYVVGNLTGTEIDYAETIMGAGFVFSNPNSKTTCGCGSSYSA